MAKIAGPRTFYQVPNGRRSWRDYLLIALANVELATAGRTSMALVVTTGYAVTWVSTKSLASYRAPHSQLMPGNSAS